MCIGKDCIRLLCFQSAKSIRRKQCDLEGFDQLREEDAGHESERRKFDEKLHQNLNFEIYIVFVEMLLWSNSGQHEDLRRLDCAGAEDDLLLGVDGPDPALVVDLDSHRAVVLVKQDLVDEGVQGHVQVVSPMKISETIIFKSGPDLFRDFLDLFTPQPWSISIHR